MAKQGKGTLFKRVDGKFLVYLPKDVCEDTMFPFTNFKPGPRSPNVGIIPVKVMFESYHPGKNPRRIIIEPWSEP